MFDCGIHPGYSGVNSLPYLDGDEDIDISKVDVALITHFHLDHCAAVPYLLSKTRFKVSAGRSIVGPSFLAANGEGGPLGGAVDVRVAVAASPCRAASS